VWQANEKKLAKMTDNPEVAEHIRFIADHYGEDSEIDGQGRVLLPTGLRRDLKLENQQVWLQCIGDAVSVFSNEIYEETQREARENLGDKLKFAKQNGLR